MQKQKNLWVSNKTAYQCFFIGQCDSKLSLLPGSYMSFFNIPTITCWTTHTFLSWKTHFCVSWAAWSTETPSHHSNNYNDFRTTSQQSHTKGEENARTKEKEAACQGYLCSKHRKPPVFLRRRSGGRFQVSISTNMKSSAVNWCR